MQRTPDAAEAAVVAGENLRLLRELHSRVMGSIGELSGRLSIRI
jgi:hypothetical protein